MIALRGRLFRLFSVFSLLVMLSLVPVSQAVTIIVDGDPSDWNGIPPIVEDPNFDVTPSDTDIYDCFVTDDCVNLYFLVTFLQGIPDELMVYIDQDQNPATGQSWDGFGADVVLLIDTVNGFNDLYIWDEISDWNDVGDIPYVIGTDLFELSATLEQVGISQGASINLFFMAMMFDSEIDFAPDEGHVTYTCNDDEINPTISDMTPTPGTEVSDTKPTISASLRDVDSGIDVNSVTLTVDGTDVTSSTTITPTSVSYSPSSDLSEGFISVIVTVSDKSGNEALESWTFTVKLPPPAIPGFPFEAVMFGALLATGAMIFLRKRKTILT